MEIQTIKANDLVPYPKNHRIHPQKQIDLLAKNIERFGFTTPVLIDEQNNVIAGHGRLLALKQLGQEEVPCVRIEGLSEEDIKILRLADNQIAQMGETDLALVIEELKLLSPEMLDLTGFSKDLLITSDEKDDEVPSVPEEPQSKLGDLYELGAHRVLCGDATQQEAVSALMGGKKADMLISDPPYGVSYADKNRSLNAIAPANRIQTPIENDHLEPEAIKEVWISAFTNAYEATKDKACYYINAMQGGDLMMMMSILSSGWNLKHMMIWVKNNHVLGRMDYHYQHEPIFYGWKEGKSHEWFGGHSQTSIWKVDKPLKSDLHPTMKPVELICKPILNSSKDGHIILDLFLGSGSTLIAAEKTGRICFGCEISPAYVDVIISRYCQYVGNNRILKNGKEIIWEDQKSK